MMINDGEVHIVTAKAHAEMIVKSADRVPNEDDVHRASDWLNRLFLASGFISAGTMEKGRNPVESLIGAGDRVLVKPNWVLHRNNSGAGIQCLITDTALICALLQYLMAVKPASICLGDAPVQGCCLDSLFEQTGILGMMKRLDSEALASDRTRLDRDSFLKFDSKSQISEMNEIYLLSRGIFGWWSARMEAR